MIPAGADIALRAVGTALAGVSIAFAGYMLAYGDGQVRVLGMEHLAIFAQPRGLIVGEPPPGTPPQAAGAVDMAETGSVADLTRRPLPARPGIVAARSDRVWLRIEGKIVSATPGEDVAGLGRIGAIVRRNGGWAVLDDRGTTLLTLSSSANGAALFSRKLIFD